VTPSSTAPPQPVHPRRRARWIVVAALFLVVGIALLAYSLNRPTRSGAASAPSPSPTTTLSPYAQTYTVAAEPCLTCAVSPLPPQTTVVTTYFAVPAYVPVPYSQAPNRLPIRVN
jgi:hypothetical protein